jgi:trimeric autotransporter adhesin
LLMWLIAAHAQPGLISTVAGRTPVNAAPVRAFDGDGGPAIAAALSLANFNNLPCDPNRFEQTSHISLDAKGNLYLADSTNQRIRRIDPSGVISSIAGSGDPQTGCQPPPAFNPADVFVLSNGNLIVADQQNNRIRQITPAGAVTTLVGNGLHNPYSPSSGVPATASPMDWPSALAVDANGVIYFAELHSNRVGRIVNGTLSTVAGIGSPQSCTRGARGRLP